VKEFSIFQGVQIGDVETSQNPLFPSHFWGKFGIFRGEKGTPDHKNRKFYLLDILLAHQDRQLFLSKYFPKVLSLGDG
jgi:hypothetical protein